MRTFITSHDITPKERKLERMLKNREKNEEKTRENE